MLVSQNDESCHELTVFPNVHEPRSLQGGFTIVARPEFDRQLVGWNPEIGMVQFERGG